MAAEGDHEVTRQEWSIARVLSKTTPRDVCTLAAVNRCFRLASGSDVVWDNMLPARCSQIVEQADGPPIQFESKKDLYFRLCDSIFLKGGTQKYWLHRPTGEECYMVSAKALSIAWGDTPQYWNWSPKGGSWFQEVAHLNLVWWFDVKGSFQQLLRRGTYTVSFRISLDPKASGWANTPIHFCVSTSNGQYLESLQYFDRFDSNAKLPRISESAPNSPSDKESDWVEFDAGEIVVEDDDQVMEIEFAMQETKDMMNVKRGVYVDGVMIRPSHVVAMHACKSTLSHPPLHTELSPPRRVLRPRPPICTLPFRP